MTTLTGLCPPIRPSGFDAALIRVGHWLVTTGERLAAQEYAAASRTAAAHTAHEDRLRDGAALRHSGIWS